MNPEVTVVILAAGLGTRMKSSKAKVLHEAAGETLLNLVVRAALKLTGPEQIVVVVGHQADQVKASVPVRGIRFTEQQEQKGTGHALLCARAQAGTNDGLLLILNGDGPLLKLETLQKLIELQQTRGEGGCVVTVKLDDPTGYGRVVRDQRGRIAAIVEQKSASAEQLQIQEINTGVYLFRGDAFWAHVDKIKPDNAAKEYYLTDMIEILTSNGYPISPLLVEDETEVLGINTRAELAVADRILRVRKNYELMLSGVTIENPDSVLIDLDVSVGPETVIGSQVQLRGVTIIGENCKIGAGTILRNCHVGDNVEILPYVVAQDSRIGAGAWVGPFARLRQSAEVGNDAHIGNFVELKNTSMGQGAKANHLAYLGDASVGVATNIGAGTITCNYDGVSKHRTEIGDRVFVGSNSTLVAPLGLGSGSYIAAGSVITEDVEPDALGIGRERQVNKPGWAKKRRMETETRKKN